MSAARGLSLGLAMNGHERPVLFVRLVARLRLERLDGRGEHIVRRRVEAGELVGRESRALAEGQEFGFVEDLVGVGVTNTGDERLVAQEVLQLAGMAADAL